MPAGLKRIQNKITYLKERKKKQVLKQNINRVLLDNMNTDE